MIPHIYYHSSPFVDIFDTPPKVVERHYDRESVRRYMKGKEEEKRRKIREEKEAQLRAQQERERRLKVRYLRPMTCLSFRTSQKSLFVYLFACNNLPITNSAYAKLQVACTSSALLLLQKFFS